MCAMLFSITQDFEHSGCSVLCTSGLPGHESYTLPGIGGWNMGDVRDIHHLCPHNGWTVSRAAGTRKGGRQFVPAPHLATRAIPAACDRQHTADTSLLYLENISRANSLPHSNDCRMHTAANFLGGAARIFRNATGLASNDAAFEPTGHGTCSQ